MFRLYKLKKCKHYIKKLVKHHELLEYTETLKLVNKQIRYQKAKKYLKIINFIKGIFNV